MDITPPAGDKGIRQLKLDNENKTVKPATAVAAYPAIGSSEQHHEPTPPLTVERRRYQRRSGDLRSRTPFDTRSGQGRRKCDRLTDPDMEVAPERGAPHHIDELV